MIYYVDVNQERGGNGTKEQPFRTIDEAARIAVAGDEVLVAPGIYREKVTPVHAGTSEKRIVYRSLVKRAAIITGAEVLVGWKLFQGTVWTVRVRNSAFGDYHPYREKVCGDWYFASTVRHTGTVYLNDQAMYETETLEECLSRDADPYAWERGTSIYKWFSVQDRDETVFYANFQGLDPNKEKTEISVRRNCFMPDENGIDFITVSGFTICKGATTWAPPAAYQDGLIGPHWSRGWIIEDCEIYGSRCCGISLGKYLDPENNMYFYTRHVKSPTQMERDAVCRGQYHGWLKEKVGSHLIRRCEIHHCEQTGIVGRMGGVFSTIEDCDIHHICNSQQLGGAETAGIKLHAAIDVTVRRCHIHHCIMGIWFDWQAQGARITGNLLHDNQRPEGIEAAKGAMFNSDIFVEVGHGPTLVDHNLMMSAVSLVMPSQGIACVHNLMLGSFGLINSGVDSIVNGQREPRYTPYHIRHRTEVAGFMTILHGDDRIYNNLIIQTVPVTNPETKPSDCDYQIAGTAPFDIFPDYEEWLKNFRMEEEPDMGALAQYHFGHLPVWVDGNAYFNGATVSKHDHHALVGPEEGIYARLREENGTIRLETNLFDAIGSFRTGILHSDLLGKAFEPEQRFENPDGTAILFDRDYFDSHRGIATIPGPFADPAEVSNPVWRN